MPMIFGNSGSCCNLRTMLLLERTAYSTVHSLPQIVIANTKDSSLGSVSSLTLKVR
jgi:hypothetical protein